MHNPNNPSCPLNDSEAFDKRLTCACQEGLLNRLRSLEALSCPRCREAAAEIERLRGIPNRDQIDSLLYRLDEIARKLDFDEFGLPILIGEDAPPGEWCPLIAMRDAVVEWVKEQR